MKPIPPRSEVALLPAVCLCGNIRRAARVVTSFYNSYLSASRIRAPQMPIFVVLELMGPLTMAHMAEALAMDRTTLARNLRPLEAQGLITRVAGLDRRTKEVALTEDGRAALAEALPHWRRAHERATAELGEEQRAALVAGLKRVAETLPFEAA